MSNLIPLEGSAVAEGLQDGVLVNIQIAGSTASHPSTLVNVSFAAAVRSGRLPRDMWKSTKGEKKVEKGAIVGRREALAMSLVFGELARND